MSRKKNIKNMIVSSAINQFVVILAGIILPPLIIANYGSVLNGFVSSVRQILNYFQVFSVGIGAAGQVALYEPLAKKDSKKINEIMSEISIFLNKIGFILASIIIILAFVFPRIRSDGISKNTIAIIVLICGVGSLIEFMVLTKYRVLLRADQKQYISSRVNTQGILINVTLSVILIYLDASIILVQLVATFAYVARIGLFVRKIKVIYPELNIKGNSEEKLIKNKKEAFLYKLTEIINNYIPMTIVMLICGFKDVSIYSVYNLIFTSIVMLVNIFANGFSSIFGNVIARNENEMLKKYFYGFNFLFRVITFWFYSTAVILIIPFISIYIRNSDGVQYLLPSVGIGFALSGLFRAIRTPAITMIDASGNYSENLKLNYLEVIINIFLSIILTYFFGMIGVLIGGTISSLFRSVFFIYDVDKKIIKQSFFYDIIILMGNFALSSGMYIFFHGITSDNFFEWIYLALLISIINALILGMFNFLMDKRGFVEFYGSMKGILKRD